MLKFTNNMNPIISFNSDNKALNFIEERIKSPYYRGNRSSEHNRYDSNEIYEILSILNDFTKNNKLMRIRDTDLSKRPGNTDEEREYSDFCEKVKERVGKGTQDSLRKNIFVDLHRMELIERYDKDKVPIDTDKKHVSVKYISLTDFGLKFINTKDKLNRMYLFTKALNNLFGGLVGILLEILTNPEYDISYIDKYEFMFFITAIDTNTDYNIETISEAVKLIKEYRLLSEIQKKYVINELKTKMIPSNYKGNKNDKRDFHNWNNKIDQLFYLFKESPYFIINNKNRILLISKEINKNGEVINKKFNRNYNEKYNYFDKHNIKKRIGFELHHVIPLCFSESPEQFKLLDTWKNMIYIDAFSHSKITQNRHKNISMTIQNNDVFLNEIQIFNNKEESNKTNDNAIILKYKENIEYSLLRKTEMLSYNKTLLETLK